MSIRRFVFLILIAAIAVVMPLVNGDAVQAARNPFIASKTAASPPEKKSLACYPDFLYPAMQKIAVAQQVIRQNMVRMAGEIRQHPFGRSFQTFMALALLYGAVHALGPGHGKMYACAYFLNRPGTIKKGLSLSCLTMVMHVFSAAILILAGTLVLKTSGTLTLETAGVVLERVSYGLLAGLGLFLAGHTVVQLRSRKFQGHHGCPDGSETKSLIVAALAIGIVPCPGAAMILLFCLTLGILPAGLGAMICLAAGMSATIGLFAVLTIVLKQRFLVLVEGNRRLFNTAYAILALGGAAAITIIGLVLFIGSVNPNVA
jgi:nickel/cobalt transporter (NicO) family protein